MQNIARQVDRAREAEIVVELRIKTYGKPEDDYETARVALSAVTHSFPASFGDRVRGRWKRAREKSTRPVVLREHG